MKVIVVFLLIASVVLAFRDIKAFQRSLDDARHPTDPLRFQEELHVMHSDGAKTHLAYDATHAHDRILLADYEEHGVSRLYCDISGQPSSVGKMKVEFRSLAAWEEGKKIIHATGGHEWSCVNDDTGAATPFYLRIVGTHSQSQEKLSVVFYVAHARITDIFKHLKLQYHYVPASSLEAEGQKDGETLMQPSATVAHDEYSKTLSLASWNYDKRTGKSKKSISLFSNANVQVDCTDCFSATDLGLKLSIDIYWFSLNELAYSVSMNHITNLDVKLTMNGAYSQTSERLLLKGDLPRISFMVGVVPVFISPSYKIYGGIIVRAKAKLIATAGFDIHFYGSRGHTYMRGKGWKPTSTSTRSRSVHGPTFHAEGTALGRVYLRMEVPISVSSVFEGTPGISPFMQLTAAYNHRGLQPFSSNDATCRKWHRFEYDLIYWIPSKITSRLNIDLIVVKYTGESFEINLPTIGPYRLRKGCFLPVTGDALPSTHAGDSLPDASTTVPLNATCSECARDTVQGYGVFGPYDSCGANHFHDFTCSFGTTQQYAIRFKASSTGYYIFSVDDAPFDSVLEIRESCCGAVMDCSDDRDFLHGLDDPSLGLHLIADQEILLIVSGYSGACGGFTLNVTEPSKENLEVWVSGYGNYQNPGYDSRTLGTMGSPVRTIKRAFEILNALWADETKVGRIILFPQPGWHYVNGDGSSFDIHPNRSYVISSMFDLSIAEIFKFYEASLAAGGDSMESFRDNTYGTCVDTYVTSLHGKYGDKSYAAARFLSVASGQRITVSGVWMDYFTSYDGSGFFVEEGGSLTIRNTMLTDLNIDAASSSTNGGGIFANGGDVLISGSWFTGNKALDTGGSVYLTNNANFEAYDTFFDDSYASTQGGAIYVKQSGETKMEIVEFAWNVAADGAALWIEDSPPATIRNVYMFLNGGYTGTCIHMKDTRISLQNAKFEYNHANCLYATGATSRLMISNSVANWNRAPFVHVVNDGLVQLINTDVRKSYEDPQDSAGPGAINCDSADIMWDEMSTITSSFRNFSAELLGENVKCQSCFGCADCSACDICGKCTLDGGCDEGAVTRECQENYPGKDAICSQQTGLCECYGNGSLCDPGDSFKLPDPSRCSDLKDIVCEYVTASTGGNLNGKDESGMTVATVKIPENSLSTDTVISVQPVNATNATLQVYTLFSTVASLQPHGLTFANPVTVTLTMDCSIMDFSNLTVARWVDDEATEAASFVSDVVWEACTASFTVTSFSRYAVVEQIASIASTSGSSSSGSVSTTAVSAPPRVPFLSDLDEESTTVFMVGGVVVLGLFGVVLVVIVLVGAAVGVMVAIGAVVVSRRNREARMKTEATFDVRANPFFGVSTPTELTSHQQKIVDKHHKQQQQMEDSPFNAL